MSDKEDPSSLTGNELVATELADVAGGGSDCGATFSAGTDGVTFNSPVQGLGANVISTYEGLIEATSHAIERIANALK